MKSLQFFLNETISCDTLDTFINYNDEMKTIHDLLKSIYNNCIKKTGYDISANFVFGNYGKLMVVGDVVITHDQELAPTSEELTSWINKFDSNISIKSISAGDIIKKLEKKYFKKLEKRYLPDNGEFFEIVMPFDMDGYLFAIFIEGKLDRICYENIKI